MALPFPSLCLLLLACSFSTQDPFHTVLPQLHNETFAMREEIPLNVTVGQYFSIYLPQFDIEAGEDDLKVYELSQEKFISLFETMEKHEGSSNEQTRKEVSERLFECDMQLPAMTVSKTVDTIYSKATTRFNFHSDEEILYVPVRSRRLLYTLDTSTLVVSVYHFTSRKLNFLSSAKVQSLSSSSEQQRIAMGCDSAEEFVYVFSNVGMWSIKTKTVLTNVDQIDELHGFSSIHQLTDKLYHGSYGFLYGLKRHEAVYLIPESSEGNAKMQILNEYEGGKIYPQDIYVDGRILYVLDSNQGIFVFKITGDGRAEKYDRIDTNTYGNKELIVKEYSILIKYMDQEGYKILELSYEPEQKVASLVRYFKQDEAILSMSLQAVPVTGQSGRVSGQFMVFFVTDSGQIHAYPYNIDPRVIRKVHNGVKMSVDRAKKIIYIFEDLYIIVTQDGLLYAHISIILPQFICRLPKSTGHIYYQLEVSSDISSCEQLDRSLAHKKFFNSNCRVTTTYGLFVNDPELSKFQKVILYGIVFAVVVGFLIGLLCLIQWRNNKLSLIGRIKDEILRFRDRHRKMQPFTEEEPDKNKGEVEFELPDQIAPVPLDE